MQPGMHPWWPASTAPTPPRHRCPTELQIDNSTVALAQLQAETDKLRAASTILVAYQPGAAWIAPACGVERDVAAQQSCC